MKKIKGLRTHLKNLSITYFNTYLIIAVATYAIVAISKDTADILKMHLLMILPLYLYVIRKTVRHLVPFFLAHAAAALPVLIYALEGNVYGSVIMGVAIAIFIFYSFAVRLTDVKNETTLGGLIVLCCAMAAGYFCADIPGLNIGALIQPYLVAASAAVLAVFFVNMHSKNVESTLNNVNEMLNQPEQKIRKFNNRILLYFILGTIVLVTLALVFRLDQAIIAMGQALLWVVRFLVSLIPKGSAPAEESIIAEETPTGGGSEPLALPEGETGVIWLYLEKIVVVAAIAAIIAIVVYGLYRFYKWFYSRKVDTVTTDEYEETSVYMEKKEKAERTKGNLWERLRPTNEKKVRRLYRKRLEEPMKKQQIRPSDSPGEILRTLPSKELEALTPLYEKARYSKDPITKEDLKSVEG